MLHGMRVVLFPTMLLAGLAQRTAAQEVFGDIHIVSNEIAGISDAWPADIDEDGHQDLVFFTAGHSGWFVNKGNGTFRPLQPIDGSLTGVLFGAMADMDNDGHIDPVMACNDGRLAYVPRITGTEFAPPVIFADSLGTSIKSVEIVDLEPDGDMDVIAALGSSGPFGSCYWVNDGAGNMGDPVVLLDLADGRGLGVGDINGDGSIDVHTILGTNVVRSLNIGNAEFQDYVTILQPTTGIRTGGCVEMNGDGHPDLLLMMYDGQVKVGLNDGSGDIPAYTTEASGFTDLHTWGSADLNADGYSDLYITSFDLPAQMHVLLNDGAGNWPVSMPTQPQVDRYAYHWHPGDMDGDGDADLVIAMNDRLGYLANAGEGSFPGVPIYAPCTISSHWVHGADVDNDGVMDLLTGAAGTGNGSGDAGWYRGDGTPELGPYLPLNMDMPESDAHLALDADNDGDVDVFIGVTSNVAPWNGFALYRFNGTSFDPGELLPPLGGEPLRVWLAPGDPNGDGLPDAMHASYEPNNIGWYRNEGNGQIGTPTLFGPSWPTLVYNHDMDDDGDRDILYKSNNGIAEVIWRENDGTGSVLGTSIIIPYGTNCSNYVMEDPDLDGDLDALANIEQGGEYSLRWYWNTGGGVFSGTTSIPIAVDYYTKYITGLVDADLLPDMIVSLPDDETYWCRNLGGGEFSEPILIEGIGSAGAFELMDFDGDGDNDLLVDGYTGSVGVAWLEGISDLNVNMNTPPARAMLSVRPSILSDRTTIHLPTGTGPGASLRLVDMNGRIVREVAVRAQPTVVLHRESLSAGLYEVQLLEGPLLKATARLVIS